MTEGSAAIAAFDRVAARYAEREQRNLLLSLMKRRARRVLLAGLPRGALVCDAGCGPGADAARFAAAGCRVAAFDASTGMIRAARRRLARWTRAGMAHATVATLRGFPARAPRLAGACDAVWAFWVTAFSPRLADLADVCAFALKPGGRAVFTIPGRWCAWEIARGLFRADPAAAFRRFSPRGVRVAVGGRPVRVHAPPFARAMAPFARGFTVERVEALGLILPPPFLWRPAWRRAAPLWSLLDAVERRAGAWPPLPRLADHVLVSLRKC